MRDGLDEGNPSDLCRRQLTLRGITFLCDLALDTSNLEAGGNFAVCLRRRIEPPLDRKWLPDEVRTQRCAIRTAGETRSFLDSNMLLLNSCSAHNYSFGMKHHLKKKRDSVCLCAVTMVELGIPPTFLYTENQRKSPITHVTLEGFDARVNVHVLFQTRVGLERLLALVTLIGFVRLEVLFHVPQQRRLIPALLLAMRALNEAADVT